MDVRSDFPILKRKINGKQLVYFDNAATTQKPVQVIEAITDFYENHNANLGRGIHTLAIEATEMFENARKKVAKFVGARPEEVIFTYNATEGLNRVAQHYGEGLRKSDEVVTTILEHHSNYVPWKMVCERSGAELKIADIDDHGKLDLQDYESKVSRDTKAVAATHVSNVLGTINPVKEMIKVAHENGAIFSLDAAQSAAHTKVDVKKLDCDFMAFSGHKMLGPTGIGVLYIKKGLLGDKPLLFTGGGTVSKTYPGKVEFLKPPARFEAGTQNVAGAIGLAAAIDYLEKIDMNNVQKHEKVLTEYALKNLDVDIYGPTDRTGVIAFNVEGVDPHEVATILDENGIAVRSGHHCAQPLMSRLGIEGCARMSFYVYNTKEEVDYTLGIIDKIKSLA